MSNWKTFTRVACFGLTLLACSGEGPSDTGSAGSEVNAADGPKTDPAKGAQNGSGSAPATPAPKFGSAAECQKATDPLSCLVCCAGTTKQPDVADRALTSCLCRRAKENCPPEQVKAQCSLTGEITPNASESGSPTGTTSGGSGDCDVNVDLDVCTKEASDACQADPDCAGTQKCVVDSKCSRFEEQPGGDPHGHP